MATNPLPINPDPVYTDPVKLGPGSTSDENMSVEKTHGETTSTEMTVASAGTQLPPVVLDIGKAKKKLIRALKRGEGKLMGEVAEAVEAVRSNLSAELEGKALIPVVIVYERKTARKGGGLLPFSF